MVRIRLLVVFLVLVTLLSDISCYVQPIINKLEDGDYSPLGNVPPIVIEDLQTHNKPTHKYERSEKFPESDHALDNLETVHFTSKQNCDRESAYNCAGEIGPIIIGVPGYLVDQQNEHLESLRELYEELSAKTEESEVIGSRSLKETPSFVISKDSIKTSFNENSVFFLPIPPSLSDRRIDTSEESSNGDGNYYVDGGIIHYDDSDVSDDGGVPGRHLLSLRGPPELSEQCSRDVQATFHAFNRLLTLDTWHLSMMDSWGKGKDGRLLGNSAIGSFKECLDVTAEGKYNNATFYFTGQYCLISAYKTGMVAEGNIPRAYGTCIPSSCSPDELKDSLNYQMDPYGYTTVYITCQHRDEPLASGPWVVAGCTVIGVMTLAVVLATCADLILKGKIHPIIKAYSATENMAKIMAVKTNDPREISCLYGIRVMSICWVLLGHQYVLCISFASNIFEMNEIFSSWGIQIIWSGYRAVDTFFTIAGILLTKSLLANDFCVASEPDNEQPNNSFINKLLIQSIKAQGAVKTISKFIFNYAFFIFVRIVRMIPTILLVVMFCAGPSEWVVTGPYTQFYKDAYLTPCRDNWWVDLSFFSNVIGSSGEPKSCAPQTWYISVDFQLYLAAPFLILPVKFFKHKLTYLSLLTLISCLIPGIIVVAKDLIPAPLLTVDMDASSAYTDEIYMMSYTRASPYFVGAACAVILDRVSKLKKGERWWARVSNKVILSIGWVLFTVGTLTVVFCLAAINNFTWVTTADLHFSSKFVEFIYASFAIAVWAACVCWIVVVCYMGLGGPVNTFLSHPLWQPCSRVTFSVFLISLPMQMMIYFSLRQTLYITHLNLLLGCGGVILFSYLAAFPISVIAEAPYINLLKIMRKK